MKNIVILLSIFFLLTGFREPDEKKYLSRKVEDIMLTDAEGKQFLLSSLFNSKPIVLSLIYTRCPSVCTITSGGIKSTLNKLGDFRDDFTMLSFSFDPATTQKDLEQYAARWDMDRDHWKLATAVQKEDINKLLGSMDYQVDYDPVTNEFQHADILIILTPTGRISRYIYGSQPRTKDLRLAIMEADGEMTSPGIFSGLYLKCFQYDAASKTYKLDWSFIISTFAGILMIIIISTLILKSFIIK